MLSTDRRIVRHIVLAGLLAAAVGLSGCGRRGPLEPPPSAAVTAPAPGATARPETAARDEEPDEPASIPRSTRSSPLDFLL